MSDIKFCDSCGNRIPMAALFCPKCGQKQEPLPASEFVVKTESIEQDSIIETPVISEEQNIEQEQTFNQNPGVNENSLDMSDTVEQITEVNNESEPVVEQNAVTALPEQSEVVEPVAPQSQNTYIPQPQPIHQPQPQYPSTYPQAAQVAQPKGGVIKKKFPWVFTILWIILLGAVGTWAYFLLIHPTYDYPKFTEDAQRIALFTACIAALIYTLSLKLTMKKLKALPTVIMILLALVGFFFFCMVELQDGDLLHDTISTFVESILP